MRRSIFCLLAVPCFALALGCGGSSKESAPSASAEPGKTIDDAAEPHHHLAFQNQYVRAFMVRIEPQESTLKHQHNHDYVNVTLGPAELSNEIDGKPPAAVKPQEGQVRSIDGRGPPHVVRNVGTTPYRNLTIEILKDGPAEPTLAAKWDEDKGVSSFDGGSREIILVKDGVRVSKIQLKPGGGLPKQTKTTPTFIVALTDLDLKEAGTGRSVQLKSGDVKWDEDGSIRALSNNAKQDARLVTLEFPATPK